MKKIKLKPNNILIVDNSHKYHFTCSEPSKYNAVIKQMNSNQTLDEIIVMKNRYGNYIAVNNTLIVVIARLLQYSELECKILEKDEISLEDKKTSALLENDTNLEATLDFDCKDTFIDISLESIDSLKKSYPKENFCFDRKALQYSKIEDKNE